MKKFLLSVTLFALSFNSYAQNDSIRKPIECGTGRIIQMQQQEYLKIIEDFITHSKNDANVFSFVNGLSMDIGKLETSEQILKKGLKYYNWNWEDINILYDKDIHHILFSYKNTDYIGLYTESRFRIYNAFFWKNQEHSEVVGKWLSNKFFTKSNQTDFELIEVQPLSKNLDLTATQNHNYRLNINEDYTFEILDIPFCSKDCFPEIKGRYGFSADGKIYFYCNLFYECTKNCNITEKNKTPFVSGPFTFKKEDDSLILKK